MDAIVNKLEQERKRSLSFYDTEAKKIAEIHRIAERQALDQAKGFRQSHGEVVKLKKEMTEVKDLFDSLYRKPAKFKDFKPFKVTEDIMQAMTHDLGREMIDAGEAIRKNVTEHAKEQKKHLNLYKEWRKGLTGVLIDLHWLRILGANSKILAMNTQMLGKAFGYLIDMALLPLVPAMVQFTKYIIGVAKWMRQLPQPARLLVAGLAALAIGVTTLGTILMYATSALTAFSAAVTAATAAETAKTGQTTLGAFGATAGGGGLLASVGMSTIAAALIAGPMYGKLMTGGFLKYAGRPKEMAEYLLNPVAFAEGGIATKPTLGIFGEGGAEAIIPLSKIGEVMGGILGAGASFANTLTQAATGGGGVGGGLNMGGGTGGSGGLLAKGFTWVAMAINQGFKINNELLAAILALLAQGGAGGGGEAFKAIYDSLVNFAQTAWAAITAMAQAVWNEVLSIAKGVWDAAYTFAVDAWNNIVTFATGVWDKITQIGGQAWTAITTKAIEIWDTISTKASEIWETIKGFADGTFTYVKDGFTTVIGAILSIIPGRQEGGEVTPNPTPTGPEGTGGGTPGGGAPMFEGLQKVFENGVYIGDWELYSDGSKKWRPHAGTPDAYRNTAPTSGSTTSPLGSTGSGAGASNYINTTHYITEGADQYAKTVNDALNSGAETISESTSVSTTSFVDVFVDSLTAVGSMVWNTLTDVSGAVYETVTGAASAIGSAAIGAITTANNWLSSTFGGLGGSLGVPAPPFIPPIVAAMATGGSITSDGLAFLHKGETVVPAAGVDRANTGGGVTINNPTFVISGRTDRELFENFMRMMKSEGARVH